MAKDTAFQVSKNKSNTLKGIAMLMIVFVHCLNEYGVFHSDLSELLLIPDYGSLGCSLFFLLSGYGMWLSCSKKGKTDVPYLYRHLKKLIVPFLVAFVIAMAVLAVRHKSIDAVNVLTLNMPNGIDLWFFKMVFVNYVIVSLLFMRRIDDRKRIVVLGGLYVVLIPTLYYLHFANYWYLSIMQFPIGAAMAYDNRWIPKKNLWACVGVSLFAACYLARQMHVSIPVLIMENTCFAVSMMTLIRHTSRLLEYIGKNSLYFYLFGIPVMMAIDSGGMHWSIYLGLNLLFSIVAVTLFTSVVHRETESSR